MEFTGERFLPEMDANSEISVFHYQRYRAAAMLCKEKAILDAACGEGYGSDLLSKVASSVIGVDISEEVIRNAKVKYKDDTNLTFQCSTVTELPVEDHSIDVVVSFETIEHVSAGDQELFFKEIKRVLKDDGILIMSSPDKRTYSDIPHFINPFHVHELYFDEFDALISKYFTYSKYWYQGMYTDTYIYDKENAKGRMGGRIEYVKSTEEDRAEYIIAICSMLPIKYDINDVIPDSINRYYTMKDEIRKLKFRLGDPGRIIEQKDSYIREQAELMAELKKNIKKLSDIAEQKEQYIGDQRQQISDLRTQVKALQNIAEQKEQYIGDQRQQISDLRTQVKASQIIAEQKEQYIQKQRQQIEALQAQLKEA